MSILIGIDPGLTGAIAFLDGDGLQAVWDMPTVTNAKGKPELSLHSLIAMLDHPGARVWLEKVGAMPGQGVSSMFRFGQVVGAIECACAANRLPVQYVTPAVWKKHFGLVKDKDAARGLALQRFPDAAQSFARKKDAGRAEAALIALYGAERASA